LTPFNFSTGFFGTGSFGTGFFGTGFGSGGGTTTVLTPIDSQIQMIEQRIVDVRKRVKNPTARATQIRRLNIQLIRLRATKAQSTR
jgi:hypothetical protein